MQKTHLKSPIGILEICADENGICELNFVDKFVKTEVKDKNLKLCLKELDEYFNGNLHEFKCKFQISGTPFQKSVYEALLKIPYGKTITYAELAKNIERQKACRAVGSANSKNKIPIIIPCHRVIAGNSLGGYSGGEGLKTKIWLINHEDTHKSNN
ncbi:methylated-DNA--[protein]-cysteine S-methyltransferase [Campylobacter sp. RM16192]|uniref:methylated-DNA--[protein]-cysteine S-methyltransferase n=1 Tax=Campylobacter sp. RM16192 TaxID=1660080 RepID=UPI001451E56E|nr:methylated-DNA--[protein]-cysteine S-methyltransferase [Campylobacter sp. RM16192]QCD52712.1 O6-alkylguanine-DNA-alkyltransferase [Campylobacter sp. RM16192]